MAVVITLRDEDGNLVEPAEEGTVTITGTYKDEAGQSVTPNADPAPFWKLTDKNGTVINSLDAEALAVSSSYRITLTGADLALTEDEAASANTLSQRRVRVAWRYDSDAGDGLHGEAEIRFRIVHLAGVPTAAE